MIAKQQMRARCVGATFVFVNGKCSKDTQVGIFGKKLDNRVQGDLLGVLFYANGCQVSLDLFTLLYVVKKIAREVAFIPVTIKLEP